MTLRTIFVAFGWFLRIAAVVSIVSALALIGLVYWQMWFGGAL